MAWIIKSMNLEVRRINERTNFVLEGQQSYPEEKPFISVIFTKMDKIC